MKQDKTYSRVDKGWVKMAITLDQKMPSKEDKDRKFFIWFWWGALSILLVGAALWFTLNGQGKSKSNDFAERQTEMSNPDVMEPNTNETLESQFMYNEEVEKSKKMSSDDQTQRKKSIDIKKEVKSKSPERIFAVTDSKPTLSASDGKSSLTEGSKDNQEYVVQTIPQAPASDGISTTVTNTDNNLSESKAITFVDEKENQSLKTQNESILLEPFAERQITSVINLSAIKILNVQPLEHQLVVPLVDFDYATIPNIEPIKQKNLRMGGSVGLQGLLAHNVNMKGGRIQGDFGVIGSKFGFKIFAGLGQLRKTSTFDILDATALEEDMLSAGAEISNPGLTTNETLTRLNFWDTGLMLEYYPVKNLTLKIAGGMQNFYGTTFDDQSRSQLNNEILLSGFDLKIDDSLVPFAEYGIDLNIGNKFSAVLSYRRAFNKIIKREDEQFSTNHISAGIKYRI